VLPLPTGTNSCPGFPSGAIRDAMLSGVDSWG